MAESKSKKTAASPPKKIVDVKSGGDAASGTSKPIIVTNRAIIKDPMMAEVSQLTGGLENDQKQSEPPQATGAPEVKKRVTISVNDQGKTALPEEPAKDEAAPAITPSKKKLVIKPLSEEEPAKEEPKQDHTASAKEMTIADLAKPDPLSGKSAATAKEEVEAQSSDDTNQPEPTEAESKPKESKASKNKETAKEAPVSEEPVTPADDKAATGLQPGRSFDEAEDASAQQLVTTDIDQSGVDEKGKAKKDAKKARELTAEQQKAIESGEYFLPITTAETRRLRREIVIAVVLVVLMIAVWLNVMLDAGLLEVDGVKPLTDFFK